MPDSIMEQFASRHGTIAWRQIGEGEPVLLVHGTPFSSKIWAAIAGELAVERRIILIDLLGYGQSDKPEAVSLKIQGEIIAEFVRSLGSPAPSVVAHDFGGTAVLRAHLLHDVDYRQLVLLDPVAVRPWGTDFARHIWAHKDAFSGLPEHVHRAILDAYLSTASFRPLPPHVLEEFRRPWLGEEGQRAFYRQIALADERYTDDFADLLCQIRCPVDLLWGEEDQWLPAAAGDLLADLVSPRRYLKVPNAGHMVQHDAHGAVTRFILSSLEDGAGNPREV